MNPIYDQEITLEQAQLLPESIIVYSPITKQVPIDTISVFNLTYIYGNNNAIYLTRSDYAQYIIGNNPVPEGYGYPNKELSSGIYQDLPFITTDRKRWLTHDFNFGIYCTGKWYDYAFPLTDLARVEAEAVVSEMERTEINAAQVIWCLENPVQDPAVNKHWCNGKEYMSLCLVDYDNVTSNPNGYCYEILTTTYNSLPDEFKALAEPKPSMPVNFNLEQMLANQPKKSFAEHFNLDRTDWKAKYSELEADRNTLIKHLQEATASAESLQDRLTDAQNCIAAMEAKYSEFARTAKNAIQMQEYQFNRFEYYAQQKENAALAVNAFYKLLND